MGRVKPTHYAPRMKTKNKKGQFGPTVSEFMKSVIYQDIQTSYGTLDDMLSALKYYSSNKNVQCVFYKDQRIHYKNTDHWNFVAFECSQAQMESIYSNIAVKAVAQMLIHNSIWMGNEKPHFPIKGRPAVIFAWSKMGRVVEYHEMDQYPEVRDVIPQLINAANIRVS